MIITHMKKQLKCCDDKNQDKDTHPNSSVCNSSSQKLRTNKQRSNFKIKD